MIAASIKGVREIKRHSSNQGSVITFDMFGVRTELFVADAKYRTSLQWSSNKNACGYLRYLSLQWFDVKYINPDNAPIDCFKPLKVSFSDKELRLRFMLTPDDFAKNNTDILADYHLSNAAAWCRDIVIDDIGPLDLPNLYELMVIYLESDRIDALDPTVTAITECRQLALGNLNPNGRFNLNKRIEVWSSSLFSPELVRTVTLNGYAGWANMSRIAGVVPVKELSLIDWQKRIDLLREI